MSNTVAGFRLSTQQERLYSQQEGSSLLGGGRVAGRRTLDAAKLQEAVSVVVTRHEILRTVFHRQAGLKLPFQIIQESAEFAWQSVDLSDLEEALQGEKGRGTRPPSPNRLRPREGASAPGGAGHLGTTEAFSDT